MKGNRRRGKMTWVEQVFVGRAWFSSKITFTIRFGPGIQGGVTLAPAAHFQLGPAESIQIINRGGEWQTFAN